MLNIAGLTPVDDPAYRYQMPRIQTKIEGRGNGIKTVVVNMQEVAQALHRDPAEVTKFFGCELGAQTNYSEDTAKSVVNGAHGPTDLQLNLRSYIEQFVLCQKCRLPETVYKIKAGTIYQKCAACGQKEMVNMSHRLTTFILKQYKTEKEKRAKKEDGGEERKKKKKSSKSEGSDDKASSEGKKKKKSKKPSKDTKEDDDKEADEQEDDPMQDDEGDDSVEPNGNGTTAEAKNQEEDEIVEPEEEYVDEVDDRSALETAMERFKHFLSGNRTAVTAQIVEELRSIQTFSALRQADKAVIYVGAVFGPDAVTSNAVLTHKPVLVHLASEAYASERGGRRSVIAAMEWLCYVRFRQLLSHFPVLLKHLYDADIVEEEVFLEWSADQVPNEYSVAAVDEEAFAELCDKAAPFITWLREAEEEGDEADDDDA